jgi:hypothetical protein
MTDLMLYKNVCCRCGKVVTTVVPMCIPFYCGDCGYQIDYIPYTSNNTEKEEDDV